MPLHFLILDDMSRVGTSIRLSIEHPDVVVAFLIPMSECAGSIHAGADIFSAAQPYNRLADGIVSKSIPQR